LFWAFLLNLLGYNISFTFFCSNNLKKIIEHSDLKKIFDDSYNSLVIQAIRIVKNQETAEDIVQDCFIKLWEKKEELNISGNINAYLAKMVRNRSLDFIKKRKIQTSELNESYQGTIENNDLLELDDLQSSIDHVIDNLPEKCRQTFVLSRFEELSYQEIAEQLDISKKTVEAHISKALKSLRKNLKQFLIILIKKN
jgi:RNA polymerase sigma-70 factor (ECF subfamily)